jgi:dCTP diphosphatase
MADKNINLQELKEIVKGFAKEREWDQFHTPKNMSMVLTREASELMEIFQWSGSQASFERAKEKQEAVQDEVADVLHALLLFCNMTGIDLSEAFHKKMIKNAEKYPAEKCKGKSLKYNEYDKLKSGQ